MSQAEDRTAGPKAKIDRAREHADAVDKEIDAFRWEFREDHDSDPPNVIYRVRVTPAEVPPRVAVVVGEGFHALRSALDLLVWQLVEANGKAPTDETAFPIGKDEHAFKSRIGMIAKLLNPEAVNRIKALNPYRGGNDVLWAVHHLDNVDKHRLLLVMAGASASLTIDAEKTVEANRALGGYAPFPAVISAHSGAWRAVDGDGNAELLRLAANDPALGGVLPMTGVSIDEPEAGVRLDATALDPSPGPLLRKCAGYVEKIVETLRPLLR